MCIYVYKMENRIKFKGPFINRISLNKNDIRSSFFESTFQQARRWANIYDALLEELYEEGCLTSAKYFQILMDKENILYKNSAIRERISEEPKLLLSLFDNCRVAEKAALSGECDGPLICARLLLQCVLLLEKFNKKYDWILVNVFKIIIKIASKVCQSEAVSKEPLCKIYYKFGLYLTKRDSEEALKYLERSFELAQGTNWVLEDNISFNFSSVIAQTYASALLNSAKKVFHTAPEMSLNHTQKALIILKRVGLELNKDIFIKANLYMADLQIESRNYDASISILESTIQYIKPDMEGNIGYLTFLARYYRLKGVCLQRMKKYDGALIQLCESLKIVRQLNMKHEEGIVLLNMAEVYIDRGQSEFLMAESFLSQAKEVFVSLQDMFNTRKISYLMANLRVCHMRPQMLDLIKHSTMNYCGKYRLNRWKFLCVPFWRNSGHSLGHNEHNDVYCILKETCGSPYEKEERKGFQRKTPLH